MPDKSPSALTRADDFMRKHTGQIGGCPRIDWFAARNDLAEMLCEAEAARKAETPKGENDDA